MVREVLASDFGAIAGDLIDDSDAINAALEAAHALYISDPSAGQVIVRLDAGEYIVSGNPSDKSDGAIRLLTGTGLIGEGMGVTTLKVADGWSGNITGIVRTPFDEVTTDVTLADLTLDGNRDATDGKIDGFYTGVRPGSTEQDADITVSRVEILDCSGYGFDPHEQTIRLIIEDSVAHGNGLDGFVADFIVDGIYRNNVAYNNDRHGFNVTTSSTNLILENNIAYDNGGGGLVVQRGSEDIPFPDQIFILGGEYYGNGREGIYLKMADDIVVDGATVYGNQREGIRIDGASNVTVQNSVLFDNSQAGDGFYDEIHVGERNDSTTGNTYYSVGTQILNNEIYSTGAPSPRWGIFEKVSNTDAGDSGTTIEGNLISGMQRGDISVPGFTEFPLPDPLPETDFAPVFYGTTQAETLDLTTFQIEAVSAAEEGVVISSTASGVEAQARGSFIGDSGVYELEIGYFDENDGAAVMGIRIDGVVVDSWVADGATSSAGASASNLMSRTVVVELDYLSVIELFGTREGGELVRIDRITVLPTEDPPPVDNPMVAVDDVYDALEDEVLVVDAATGVLSNDTAADGGATVTPGEITTAQGGTVFLAADGSFTYTPRADFFGSDSFEYVASDGDGDMATGQVQITVEDQPEPPTADFPPIAVGTTQAETLDLTTFGIEAISAADGGLAISSRSKSAEAVAKGSFVGEDGFYTVSIAYFDENDGASTFGLRVNGVTVVTWVADQDLGTSGANSSNLVSFEVNVQLGALDEIEVFATRDANELVRIDSLSIAPAPDAPPGEDNPMLAADDFYFAVEDEPLVVSAEAGLLSNDTALDGGAAAVPGTYATTAGGTVTVEADGSFVYTPFADFFGTDTFEYTAFDADGDSDIATAEISVADQPEPPVTPFPQVAAGVTQAEDLDLTTFSVEALAAADGGAGISTRSKVQEASAKGTFVDAAGEYLMTVSYFDENDGASTMGVRVNDEVVATWIADQDLGVAGASPANLVTTSFVVALEQFDTIEIFGTRDGGELVRIDAFELDGDFAIA